MGTRVKETYWFKHDYEPTSDPKVQAMLGQYGCIGYGIYWRIIEMLHSDHDNKLPLDDYIFIAIANQMQANAKQKEANFWNVEILPEQVKMFVEICIKTYKLFKSDEECFWSERVLRNIDNKNTLSLIRSESGRKGGQAKPNGKQVQASAKQMQANGKQKQAEEKRREESILIIQSPKEQSFPKPIIINQTATADELILIFDERIKEVCPTLNEAMRLELRQTLSKSYVGKKINNIDKLVEKAIEKKLTWKAGDPIDVGGEQHKAKKSGNDYHYPTIKGKEFSEDKRKVLLTDGTWQELTQMESNALKHGNLTPKETYKVVKANLVRQN